MMAEVPYNIGSLCGRGEPIFIKSKVHPFDHTEKKLQGTGSLLCTDVDTSSISMEQSQGKESQSNDPLSNLSTRSQPCYSSADSDTVASTEHDNNHTSSTTMEEVGANSMDSIVCPATSTDNLYQESLDDCLTTVEPDENDSLDFRIHQFAGPTEPLKVESRDKSSIDGSKSQYQCNVLSPAIKISHDDKIPIKLSGPWSRMKIPNVADRIEATSKSQKTVWLSPLPISHTSNTDSTCRCHKSHPKRSKHVRFDAVDLRCFSQTIGDNPSVTIGTPITLDWTYSDEDHIPIDAFEEARMASRKKGNNRLIMHRLALNYYQRRNILNYYSGFTEEEIDRAEKDVARARWRRQVTALFSDWWRVEDFVTSAGRKAKRFVLRQRRP